MMVECPNCGGKGTWRREWTETRWSFSQADGHQPHRAVKFADEVCPRCEGKGAVEPTTTAT